MSLGPTAGTMLSKPVEVASPEPHQASSPAAMTTASSPAPKHGASPSQRRTVTLVTGAGGEVGHGLMHALHAAGQRIIAIDLRELPADQKQLCADSFVGDICDESMLERLARTYEIAEIYHLAALLSTSGEKKPELAHAVNVNGTIKLLHLAAEQAQSRGQRVKFMFPSSIAVYGLPSLEAKNQAGAVREDEHCTPITMYGCNKLYCEHLGRYYERHYRLLAQDRAAELIDFRCIRFPGLISADTVPTGGTSDYGPEMLHAAASGKAYACFVRPDARIPFMTMPDAIDAMLKLAGAEKSKLTRCVYNITSFNPSAGEIAEIVKRHFPDAKITFAPDPRRQQIVDSWPADVDDAAARRDWGYAPKHDLSKAFDEYLVPRIRARYRHEPGRSASSAPGKSGG